MSSPAGWQDRRVPRTRAAPCETVTYCPKVSGAHPADGSACAVGVQVQDPDQNPLPPRSRWGGGASFLEAQSILTPTGLALGELRGRA